MGYTFHESTGLRSHFQMLYLFHGEDEFTRSEALATLKAQATEGGLGEINVTWLDGRRVSFSELANACNTLPFLTANRLVIVEDLVQRLTRRRAVRSMPTVAREASAAEDEGDALVEQPAEEATGSENARYLTQVLDYLPRLPATTWLALVESTSLAPNSRVLKALQSLPEAQVRHFPLYDLRYDRDVHALREWIAHRAKAKGAEVTSQAANALIELVGNDLRALDHELEKLAAWANYARPIGLEDVRTLVSAAREADVFALVDALGMRRRQEALRLVERLLAEDKHELYLLTMIARQVRLILTAKELFEERQASLDEISKATGVRAQFLLRKLLDQAKQFTFEELQTLLGRILLLDQSFKTGRLEGPLGLDLLVLEICQRRALPVAPAPQAARGAASHQGRSRSRTR